MTTPKSKRRFLQFSLRSFFIVTTVVAIWFGWKMNEAREQKEAVEWIREMGGRVGYEYQREQSYLDDPVPPGPNWLRDLLGIDFMDDVDSVWLGGSELNDLTPLAGLKSVESLNLRNTQVTDLTILSSFDKLKWLSLSNTEVSDLTPLIELKNLDTLYLDNTEINDLAALSGLENLESLELRNTSVDDVTPLAGLAKLRALDVSNTPVDDLNPLAGLMSLQLLTLSATQVSSEQIEEFQQKSRNCEVFLRHGGELSSRTLSHHEREKVSQEREGDNTPTPPIPSTDSPAPP
jgi:hypothetical protein